VKDALVKTKENLEMKPKMLQDEESRVNTLIHVKEAIKEIERSPK
jgi:hypothetical protein